GQRRVAKQAEVDAAQYREACRANLDKVKMALRHEADIAEAEKELLEATDLHNDLVAKVSAATLGEQAADREAAKARMEYEAACHHYDQLVADKQAHDAYATFEKPLN